MTKYVCTQIVDNVCQNWIEHNDSFFDQFSQLTLFEVSAIGGATAFLFAVAWAMNLINKFIYEKQHYF